MICQKCGKNPANSHIHTVINGIVNDMYLCSSCAAANKAASFGNSDLFEMFSSLLENEKSPKKELKKCELCGATIEDIRKSGRVGCSDCYKVFKTELEPTLLRLHGRANHIGKRPKTAQKPQKNVPVKESKSEPPIDEVATLKEQLKKAISEENYEQAAVIRDEIKKREAK